MSWHLYNCSMNQVSTLVMPIKEQPMSTLHGISVTVFFCFSGHVSLSGVGSPSFISMVSTEEGRA